MKCPKCGGYLNSKTSFAEGETFIDLYCINCGWHKPPKTNQQINHFNHNLHSRSKYSPKKITFAQKITGDDLTKSAKKISLKYGVSKQYVYDIFGKLRKNLNFKGHLLEGKIKKEDLLLPISQLIRIYGISQAWAYKLIPKIRERYGIPKNLNKRKYKFKDKEIKKW